MDADNMKTPPRRRGRGSDALQFVERLEAGDGAKVMPVRDTKDG
jgi:hypothetical protein